MTAAVAAIPLSLLLGAAAPSAKLLAQVTRPDGHFDPDKFAFVLPGVLKAEVDQRLGEPFIAGGTVVVEGELDLFPYSIPPPPTEPNTAADTVVPREIVDVEFSEYRPPEFSTSEKVLIVFREGRVWYALLPPHDAERTREGILRLYGAPPVEEDITRVDLGHILSAYTILKYPDRGLGFVEKPGRGVQNRLVFPPESATGEPAGEEECQPHAAPAASDEFFEFSSGGAYHISGYGEWKIRLSSEGALSILHDLRGAVEDYGTFTLPPAECVSLWPLVRALDISSLQSSTRRPVPDEVGYTFSLRRGGQAHSVQIWANDASQNPNVVALLERLGELIQRSTGRKAVL